MAFYVFFATLYDTDLMDDQNNPSGLERFQIFHKRFQKTGFTL